MEITNLALLTFANCSWIPDVTLWNLETGLMGSLDGSYARVTNEGEVFWSRPGHLKPTCKFVGLDNFPFDSLTCTMEFGSWMFSGKYLSMEKGKDIGYAVGSAFTSGSTFEEFSFVEEDPIACEKFIYPPFNENYPDEDWPGEYALWRIASVVSLHEVHV